MSEMEKSKGSELKLRGEGVDAAMIDDAFEGFQALRFVEYIWNVIV